MLKRTGRGTELPQPGAESPFEVALAEQRRDAVAMVRQAVESGSVLLAFQPVVQARRPDRIAFHEGLIRLLDETGRIIPAADFIETVETQELGRRIDCLALQHGFAALAEEPSLRLSVNMSARSIGYPRWVQILRDGLAADPTAGERLILEITESSAMLVPDLVTAFMHELQCEGISFALDDFGAGHTSFRYLRDFSFDLLKIDGEFIAGIARNPDNQVLTQALLSIARHFDMFTVAEAVESSEDMQFLQSIGIDCLQGYYFGAPTVRPPWHSPPLEAALRAG